MTDPADGRGTLGLDDGALSADGGPRGLLSVDDDAMVYSANDVRTLVERARGAGWNAAVDAIGKSVGRSVVLVGGENDEWRRLVPEGMVDALVGVWTACFRYLRAPLAGGDARGVVRPGNGGLRTSTGQSDVRVGGARRKGSAAGSGGVIRDEVAWAEWSRIQRKLRKITRETSQWLENRDSGQGRTGARRCVKCRRYGEAEWSWCPWDGKRMEEV